MSQLDGLVVYPDGQLPGLYQRQVIFFPVVDVVFGLAHLLCLVIIPGDWEQMAGLLATCKLNCSISLDGNCYDKAVA